VSAWVDKQRLLGDAVRSVPGCTLLGNFTRFGIKDGRNDQFAAGFQYLDGFAINCYSGGMEKTPIEYTDWTKDVDPMIAWVAAQGHETYDCWETGTRSDARGLRPAYMAKFAQVVVAACKKYGVTPGALCYWDSVTTATRDTRFEIDGTATRDAWRAAFN
jgi:hypothetical protein